MTKLNGKSRPRGVLNIRTLCKNLSGEMYLSDIPALITALEDFYKSVTRSDARTEVHQEIQRGAVALLGQEITLLRARLDAIESTATPNYTKSTIPDSITDLIVGQQVIKSRLDAIESTTTVAFELDQDNTPPREKPKEIIRQDDTELMHGIVCSEPPRFISGHKKKKPPPPPPFMPTVKDIKGI